MDATGERDVSRQLNDFLAGVPDGSTVSFPANATYRIEGVLALEGRRDLTLEFNGTRLIANTDGSGVAPHPTLARYWPRHRAHLYIADSSNIEVRNLVVRGANELGGTADRAWRVEYEAQHAIEITRSTDVSIEGCDVSKIFGDGVYIGGQSQRVTVRECEIHHNGRQGVAVTGARDVVIENNHLHQIRRTAFDLEPIPQWSLHDIRIQDNRIGNTRLNFVSGHGSGSAFTGIKILDNQLETEMQISMRAPEGTRRGSVEIRGNRSTSEFGSRAALISVVRYDQVAIAENASPLDGRPGGRAVSVLEGCSVRISRNAFSNVETQQEVTRATHCPPASGAATPDSSRPNRESSPGIVRLGLPQRVERGNR